MRAVSSWTGSGSASDASFLTSVRAPSSDAPREASINALTHQWRPNYAAVTQTIALGAYVEGYRVHGSTPIHPSRGTAAQPGSRRGPRPLHGHRCLWYGSAHPRWRLLRRVPTDSGP